MFSRRYPSTMSFQTLTFRRLCKRFGLVLSTVGFHPLAFCCLCRRFGLVLLIRTFWRSRQGRAAGNGVLARQAKQLETAFWRGRQSKRGQQRSRKWRGSTWHQMHHVIPALAPKMCPNLPPKPSQALLEGPQEGPKLVKNRPRCPRGVQETPKSVQEASKNRPRGAQERPRVPKRRPRAPKRRPRHVQEAPKRVQNRAW